MTRSVNEIPNRGTALAALAVLLLPPAVGADDAAAPDAIGASGSDRDEIVVVAHKDERRVREIAANVSVVDGSDLSFELANSLADVLRYTPGVDYEGAGSRFSTEGINIRGIGGNRVAILLDGVPLGDQFDVGSFSNATRDFVETGFIDRIEVLHGPASALYGSRAIGGVASFRTPDPWRIGNGGRLDTVWRSGASGLRATATQSLTADPLALLVGISAGRSEEPDAAAVSRNIDIRDERNRAALFKVVHDDVFGNTLRAGYYHQTTAVTSDLHALLGSGRFRSTTALEGDDDYRLDLLSVEYAFDHLGRFFDGGEIRAYVHGTDVLQKTFDERRAASTPVAFDRLFSFEQDAVGAEVNLRKSFRIGKSRHRLSFGLEYRSRRTEEFRDGLQTDLTSGDSTNVLLGEVFPLRDFPISRSTDKGVYVEDSIDVGAFTVIAALRADSHSVDPRSDPLYAEDYPFAEIVGVSDSEVSPKFGVVYRLNPDVEVYAQYAHGFRAPPYEDANVGLELPVFNVRAVPNPDLRSEKSDGIDVGVRLRTERGSARIAAFYSDYEDFIESRVFVGVDAESGRRLFQARNVDRARIRGVEIDGTLALTGQLEDFSIDGHLYWVDGENPKTGEALNSVGPAQALLGLSWSPADGRWLTRLVATHTDAWTDRDETSGDLFRPDAYTVVDLFVARRLGERATARLGLLNLTDEVYWSWSDVRGLDPDDPVLPFLSRPGREVTLGLDFRW